MSEFIEISRVFSSRFVVEQTNEGTRFVKKNSPIDLFFRAVSWVYAPSSYKEENRKTISCFEKYLKNCLGEDRLKRICSRYHLDFTRMQAEGTSLVSRDVAKIYVGILDVKIEDIEEFIQQAKNFPSIQETCPHIDWEHLTSANNFRDLNARTFLQVRHFLKKPWIFPFTLQEMQGRFTGQATERVARYFFDPLLTDWERIQIQKKHPCTTLESFAHSLTAVEIKREMEVGMIVPGPSPVGDPQLHCYYVAGKLITGEGMVSYMLIPATKDTPLPNIRVFRGTAFRPSEVDTLSSMITDCEPELGKMAFESGEIYEPWIEKRLPPIEVEAGHSLGSTITQHRVAHHYPRIREAYLFNGPGLTHAKVDAFNAKVGSEPPAKKIKLVIRDTMGDIFLEVGECHLGYQAPEGVEIDYRLYHPPRKPVPGTGPHYFVWHHEDRELCYGLRGIYSQNEIDQHLHRESLSCRERIRKIVGPILAALFRFFRQWVRAYFSTRAIELQGLQLGYISAEGKWTREWIKPDQVYQAPPALPV